MQIRTLLDDWLSRFNSEYSRSENSIDPEQFKTQLPSEWKAFQVGSEPNVYETMPEKNHGIRMVPPRLDAAVLIQLLSGERTPEEQTVRVALQTKLKYWETGDQYVYETRAQGEFDTPQNVGPVVEVLTNDLDSATQLGELPEDDSIEIESIDVE
jgi:hypothetical protein